MEQQIRFCTTAEGVSIAYASVGEGPPLVCCPGIYSHLEEEWNIPARRAWYERLARSCQLIRYDKRGTGLSQRGRFHYDADSLVEDVETVVDHLELGAFMLAGIVLGGGVAILYAARHPERVSRLALFGVGSRGTGLYTRKALAPLLAMARSNWPMASVLASNLATGVVDEETRRSDERYVREAVDGETFARLLELSYSMDITGVAPKVTAPALVMHQRGDRVIPIEIARHLAVLMPNARFLPLEGDSNVPFYGESAGAVLEAIIDFCGLPASVDVWRGPSELCTILFTDMEGSTIMTRRFGDAKGLELLRTHNVIVREALRAHGGSEIKHTGDGIMASFTSATRALGSAIAIQQAFADHNESHPDTPLRIRVGLNAGEPVMEEHDLYGTAVQLAARVCAQAAPGQILVPLVVRELAAGKGFVFSDSGEVALSGFEDPVRLFEVRWD